MKKEPTPPKDKPKKRKASSDGVKSIPRSENQYSNRLMRSCSWSDPCGNCGFALSSSTRNALSANMEDAAKIAADVIFGELNDRIINMEHISGRGQ